MYLCLFVDGVKGVHPYWPRTIPSIVTGGIGEISRRACGLAVRFCLEDLGALPSAFERLFAELFFLFFLSGDGVGASSAVGVVSLAG